jgi:hypothetical protein
MPRPMVPAPTIPIVEKATGEECVLMLRTSG